MGGIATNYHGEALTKRNGNDDSIIPGLMALGEAGCVSVHGANRLGSNSLIDLVVFGRAAALRCAELIQPNEKHADLPKNSADVARARLDRVRHADGRASREDAGGDAVELRRVPHRRSAGRGLEENPRSAVGRAGHEGP
jgi:succinate dehydrogenase / fumarate reductase flavoprotein subunit